MQSLFFQWQWQTIRALTFFLHYFLFFLCLFVAVFVMLCICVKSFTQAYCSMLMLSTRVNVKHDRIIIIIAHPLVL